MRNGTTTILCVLGALLLAAWIWPFATGSESAPGRERKLSRVHPHRSTSEHVEWLSGKTPGGRAGTPGRKLYSILLSWRSASVVARDRLVAEVRKSLPRLLPAIDQRLADDEAPLLVDLIEICGRLPLRDGTARLERLADAKRPTVRASALRALDRIRGLSFAELEHNLRDSSTEVLLATLEICRTSAVVPALRVVELLGATEPELREAAVRAIPDTIEEEDARALLLELATEGGSYTRDLAIQALGRVDDFPGREACLLACASDRSWALRLRALQSLANLGKPISRVRWLESRIREDAVPLKERVAALSAIEGTRSGRRSWLRESIAELHPVLQLHAARILVGMGDQAGLDALIRLLGTSAGTGLRDDDALYARVASRMILAEILEEDLGKDAVRWRARRAQLLRQLPHQVLLEPWENW